MRPLGLRRNPDNHRTHHEQHDWTAAGSPYVLEPASVTVEPGVTLTIEPGVTVELNAKRENIGGELVIKGTIAAVGTASKPIVFTSAQAAAGSGAPGQYRDVTVYSGNASSQFAYTNFVDGGRGSACYGYGALEVAKSSTVTVEHTLFERNEDAGLVVGEGSTANVSSSTFTHNCDGIATSGVINVSHSTLSYNTTEGIFGANGVALSGTNVSSSSFMYDTIRGNPGQGIRVEKECTTDPLSSFPQGEFNNIYENGASSSRPEQNSQLYIAGENLTAGQKCVNMAVNWRNNYWGDIYYYLNKPLCATTETPYKGHLAYVWATVEHAYEVPGGPISGGTKAYVVKEGTKEFIIACGWDNLLIEEFLTQPVSSAGAPGESSPPELNPPELRGDRSQSSPGLRYCMHGDPVNCATGNLYESYTDLNVPGLNDGLTLTRSYNSQAAASASSPGPFGFGWTFEFGQTLSVDPNSKAVTITDANGAATQFTPASGGTYTAAPWVQAKLTLSEGHYLYTLPNQEVLTFSEAGQLQKLTDRNGNATTLTYSGGHLETVTDPAGRKLTFAFNGSGLIESVKDPLGHLVKYTYESSNLTSVTEPGESSPRWQFKYEGSHQLAEITDGRGGKTTNKYDSSNRVTEQLDPLSRKTTWAYEPSQTKVTDPTGAVTLMQFAGRQLTSITRGYGTSNATTQQFALDGADNVLSMTDGDEHVTKYTYDGEDNRTSTLDPTQHETKWEYNAAHDVIGITSPKGEKTTIKRDSHGNAEAIERPAPGEKTQTTKYKYDSHGDLEAVEDPLKRVSKYESDAYGDRTVEIDPEGDKRTFKYDEDSSETSSVSPRGNVEGVEAAKYTTKIERDEQERRLKVTDPLGHTTKYKYDGDGNLETLTDANGHTTTYTYDADNELRKVTAPNGVTTETDYDGEGHVVAQIDGNKHKTTYVRNILGQVKEIEDPLKRKTTKQYDLAGNLERLTDPAKRTTTYKYDAANRLTEVSYSDGKTHSASYEYDTDGNRVKMEDGTGTSSYVYDQLDRLTESKDGHGNVVKYEYDLANQQTKLTYPNGKAVTRAYDSAGRVKSVTDWLEHTTSFSYDQDSNQTKTVFPTGTSEEDLVGFNEADQLTKAEMKRGAEVQASLTYARDKDGQLESSTQKGLPGEETTSYAYDENNRLTKGGTSEYKYDEANNPTKIGSSENTFDEANELTKGTGVTYSYDELGERTKRTPTTGQATTYGYDQAGDLTSVERPKEGKTSEIKDSYGSDGDGLRVSETISGSTSYLAWDVSQSLPLLVNDGKNSYIYGPGGLPVEQVSGGGTVTDLHHDQQGSTRMLSSSTGVKEASFTYDAYGNQAGHTGTATTPLGYDGQYTSSDTGLIYLRARAYDPATAQFFSVDPIASLTRTPYNYAYDNPTNFGDPSGEGLLEGVLAGAVGGLVGGVAGAGGYTYGAIAGEHSFSLTGVGVASASGAAGGAAFGACTGAIANPAVCGGVGGGAASAVRSLLGSGRLPSLGDAAQGIALGAGGGVAGRALFPLRGFRPYRLQNIWNPGPNTLLLYQQATVGGLIGLEPILFGSTPAYGEWACQ
jgi:RHS repeat-associated protein